MVLNESLANRLWPGQSAVGKRIRLLDPASFEWEVVGVVADVRQMGLARDPSGELYMPHEQWAWGSMFVTVRTDGSPASLAPAVRRAIRGVGEDITISRVAPMTEVIAESLATSRFLAGLTTAFGLLALLLGAIGVYGVMAYAVSRRIPEFGLRMALGAPRAAVLRDAMVQTLGPVAVGVAAGLAGAFATTRLLATLLYGVQPDDPVTYAAVAGGLMAVAALASYLPARRAGSADPLSALSAD